MTSQPGTALAVDLAPQPVDAPTDSAVAVPRRLEAGRR